MKIKLIKPYGYYFIVGKSTKHLNRGDIYRKAKKKEVENYLNQAKNENN